MTPRVFTIPAATPFLPTLAAALLDGALVPGFAPRHDPLALAAATLYLPTRRAARAFADALLDELGGEAALLPRVVPLGEVDEDALAFAESAAAPPRPTPIAPAARRLVLARLVRKFAQSGAGDGGPVVAATPAAALLLADALARLFDDMTIAGVSFDALDEAGFVPAELDEYWRRSLAFLKLARAGWEAYLAERGLVDPTARRDDLLGREAERLAAGGGPVIAAGSTGTIPAVARLIAAIAKRPDGAVVLPGLDPALDDPSFELIGGGTQDGTEIEPSPGHPQFGLYRLLKRIGISRDEVATLGAAAPADRARLLSESFRPAVTTERWREREADFDAAAARALAAVAVIEAADPREEALALAIALRETLETPGATAALVTPDRALARRVAAELRRWNVEADDSAGMALADTAAGRLARLAAGAAAKSLAPVPLVALLRHPLADLGLSHRAVDALEVAVLRGPRPASGPDGLARALAEARATKDELHWRDARAKLSDARWDEAARVVERVGAALAPLLSLAGAGEVEFGDLLAAHGEALGNLGLDLGKPETADARALAAAFEQFAAAAADAAPVTLSDYADAFAELLAGEPPVRPPFDRAARVRILGPLEARLIDSDRVLLGGLNEGTWPPETHADAWLNRPMRRRLGLDLPERRIGLSAHDFTQALGAREVVLTRARKQDGVETVASRFLQRIQAVAPEAAWDGARKRGEVYLSLARELERPAEPKPIERPEPRPPAEARPGRLSVTEIETLIRDPYSIYARHVLKLNPLDELDADPGAAERGTIIHAALAEFVRACPEQLPDDALDRLLRCGERAFERIKDFPGLAAIWRPRFERVARWLIRQEAEWRAEIERVIPETSGEITLDIGGRPFRLTARADRIERRRDGAVVIVDYKTGEPPSLRQALVGLAPQLPLEAAIARAGGFKDVAAGTRIAGIMVIKLSGGDPPGKAVSHDPADASAEAKKIADAHRIATCDDLADYARARVQALLATFAEARTPYHSIPRPQWRGRFGEYDHLARIKEWSAGGGGEE